MSDDSMTLTEEAPSSARGTAGLAYDRMLHMLMSRQLEPDAAVMERRLATELGVSRTPLREALHRLEGEGLLTRRPDGALAVPRVDVEEMLEVLGVRRLVEVEATGLAAGHIPAPVLEELRARVEALAISGNPDSPERLALDIALHRAVGDSCGNRVLARVIADLRRRTQFFATRHVPERLGPVCDEHLRIIEALAGGDAEVARGAMAAHIDRTRAGILHRLGGV